MIEKNLEQEKISKGKTIKRVLISGAAGFFGSHLLRHLLLNTDLEIVCVCSWKHKGTPERVKLALAGGYEDRVNVITHDLISPLTDRTIKEIGPVDYILNIASDSHVNRSIEEPVPLVQNNVNLVLNMLELSRVLKPELFLQFSTDEVYGVAPEGVDYAEWSSIVPSNPYSASKAAQEAIAISYWRTYGVPVVITNTMNLVGQTQDPEKFVGQLIRKIHKGEVVTIHGEQGSIGSRFYIHARNAADAVMFIVKNLPPKLYREGETTMPDRYNIVGEVELNNLVLAHKVASMMNKPLNFQMVGFPKDRPGHDKRYSLSGKKMADLGWKPPTDFDESLKSTVEWTLNNPTWL